MAPASRANQAHRRRWLASGSFGKLAIGLCALLLQLLATRAAASSSSMNLPDGIENILGFAPKSGFQCERDGYFGDIDNDCRLFHLCQRFSNPVTGRPEWRHWTYACGNQTMFNQLTLTCAFVDEAIPCRHASQFQYLNEVIHKPAEPFLTDADVTSGFSYYSNRVMSDGARARAFQDSELLAQIGGAQHSAQLTHSQSNSANRAQRQQLDDGESSQLFNELNANQFQQPQSEAAPVAASQQQQQHQEQPFRFHTQSQPAAQVDTQRFSSDFRQPHQMQHSNQQQPAQFNTLRQLGSGQLHSSNFLVQHQPASSASASARTETRVQPQAQARTLVQSQAQVELPQANFQSFQQQFAAAPAATPVRGEQPSEQSEAPKAFEFSITTNHQNFAGPTAEQQFFALPPIPQQQQSNQNQAAQEQNQVDLQANRFGPRAPAALEPVASQAWPTEPTTATTTTTQALTQTTTLTQPQPQTQPPTTTSVAPANSTLPAGPFISAQRLQLAQPTEATSASAPVVTEATTSSQFQTGSELSTTPLATTQRSASSSTNAALANGRRARQEARRASAVANSERSLPGFQSARLSSLNRRASSGSNETPLVMRRPQASAAPGRSSGQHSQQAAVVGSAPAGSARQGSSSAQRALLDVSDESPTSFMEAGDFWRRAFDSQLMAPKFESLMLRRRV